MHQLSLDVQDGAGVTQATKTVIYCGSFTAGGLEVATGDGRLHHADMADRRALGGG